MQYNAVEPKDSDKPVLDKAKFQFVKLHKGIDVSELDCTDDACQDPQNLHNFIQNQALEHQENNYGTSYIVYYDGKMVGYLTVATGSINIKMVPKNSRPSIDTDMKNFPAVIIAYFAVDKPLRGKGYGTYMLKYCIGLARVISRKVGCRYITLYAREAIGFYSKYKFEICEDQETRPFKLMVRHLYTENDPAMQKAADKAVTQK